MFQWDVYHSFAISSIWKNPIFFWSFWLPKVGVCLFLSSFTFFFSKNWWTIIVLVFIDIWYIANIFYLRSTGVLFDGFTFTMAGNMHGFWNSLLVLWEVKDLILFALTFLFSVLLYFIEQQRHGSSMKLGLICVFVSVIINVFAFASVTKFSDVFYRHGMSQSTTSIIRYCTYNPFSYNYRQGLIPMNKDYGFNNFSLIHGFVYVVLDYIHNIREMEHPYTLTTDEVEAIKPFMGKEKVIHYDNTLILIIVESLENWAVNDLVMPNLTKFMKSKPTLYASKVKTQILGGSSSDGQLIVQTGMLPIQQGAVVFRYPYIKFPSLVSSGDSSVTILTHSANTWNQDVMSKAYGYSKLIEGGVEDSVLFNRVIKYAEDKYRTIMAITIASHVPFSNAFRSPLQTRIDMPRHMSDYIKSIYWTDCGLGVLLDRIDSIPQLSNATIMITGDHKIFWEEKRDEFKKYCDANGLNWTVKEPYCPLIIYSPNISNRIEIDEECYQMDIYPTILHLIGCEDYYWKGFGVNLLDSAARHNRPCTEEEAYQLSDKLIRSKWFAKYSEE